MGEIELATTWELVLAVALLLAVACVPLGMVLRHLRLRAEQAHAQRMKALERGDAVTGLSPLNDRAAFISNAFRIAFWMGVAMPAAAIGTAAWGTGHLEALGHVLAVWISVATACTAAFVCATIVILRSCPERAQYSGSHDSSSIAAGQPQEAPPEPLTTARPE